MAANRKSSKAIKLPEPLYPSTELMESVKNLKLQFRISEYVDCFLRAKNPVEHRFILKEIEFKSATEMLFSEDTPSLRKLSTAWELLDGYSRLIGSIEKPPSKMNSEVKPEKVSNVDSQKLEPIMTALHQFADGLGERHSILSSKGYSHLPPRLMTVALIDYLETLSDDLGFNVFGDFDKHLAALEKALPKSVIPKRFVVPLIDETREAIFEQWTTLTQLFKKTWNACVPEIVQSLNCTDADRDSNAIRRWGNFIALWNLRAGAFAIFGGNVGKYLSPDVEIKLNNIDSSKPEQMDWLGRFAKKLESTDEHAVRDAVVEAAREVGPLIEAALCVPGVFKDSATIVGLAEAHIVLFNVMEDPDPSLLLMFSLMVSPLLVSPLRDRILVLIAEYHARNVGESLAESLGLTLCLYSENRSEIETWNEECESLFEVLKLEQRPVANPAFFDSVSNANDFTWDSSDEVMREGLRRVGTLLGQSEWDATEVPEGFRTISSLAGCLGYPPPLLIESDELQSQANGIYLLSLILHDEEYAEQIPMPGRGRDFAQCALQLCRGGLFETAGLSFCYFLVTEAIEIGSLYKNSVESRKENKINRLQPLGDWAAFSDIARHLSSNGWEDRVKRTFAVAAELLNLSNSEELSYAVSQLNALSGRSSISDKGKAAAAIVRFPQVPTPYRDRLVDLMGIKSWELLTDDFRNKLIRLERKYDLSLGDKNTYGEREATWAIDYANIIEGMLKNKLNCLWEPAVESSAIKAHQAGTGGRGSMGRFFSTGAVLYICKGAVETGDAVILNLLRKEGVDAYAVGKGRFQELLSLSRNRNLAIHPDNPSGELASEGVRLWVIKNLTSMIEVFGLKTKYFRR